MTLTTARQYARLSCRNGNDTSAYPNTSVDLAISAIGARLHEEARVTRSIDTVDLDQDTETVSFSGLTGFLPEYLTDFAVRVKSEPFATAVLSAGVVASITVNYSLIYDTAPAVTFSGGDGTGATATANLTLGRVTSFTVSDGGSGYTSVPAVLLDGVRYNYDPTSDDLSDLNVVSIDEIQNDKFRYGTGSGTPKDIAFEVEANAVASCFVWPAPSSDGLLEVCWTPPFTTFTAGTASPDSVSLNIRDSILIEALRLGGPAYLQRNEPENMAAALQSETDLKRYISTLSGKGSHGAKSIRHMSLRDRGW